MRVNLIQELGGSSRYTLHSHTEFCDGRAPMEQFAREAVRQGFTHYGFSPHSPIPFESSCNMSQESVAKFTDECSRINDLYGRDCRFYRAMEIDFLGEQWGPAHPYFESLNLDYAIGSIHFIPSQTGEWVDVDGRYETFDRKMAEKFNGDIRYVVEKFYEHSLMMVEKGGFDIIGHFNKIGNNASHYSPGIEEEGWYNALVDNLVEQIIAARLIVEINTKIFDTSDRVFPDTKYWKRLADAGIPLVVNSDAHYPELINAGRERALKILSQL